MSASSTLLNGSEEQAHEEATSDARPGRGQAAGPRPAIRREMEWPEVAKQLEVSEATYHQWRAQ